MDKQLLQRERERTCSSSLHSALAREEHTKQKKKKMVAVVRRETWKEKWLVKKGTRKTWIVDAHRNSHAGVMVGNTKKTTRYTSNLYAKDILFPFSLSLYAIKGGFLDHLPTHTHTHTQPTQLLAQLQQHQQPTINNNNNHSPWTFYSPFSNDSFR